MEFHSREPFFNLNIFYYFLRAQENIAVLLKNVERGSNTSFGRSFKIDTNCYDLTAGKNVISASFFDFYEDVRFYFDS